MANPTPKTQTAATIETAAAQMKTVKSSCDKAPAGPKKDAAMKHYQAAERAQKQKNPTETIRKLDAATLALK